MNKPFGKKHLFKRQLKINHVLIHFKQLTAPNYLFTNLLLASISVVFTTFFLSDISDISAQYSNELNELINKGIELYNLGDYEGAIRMYDRALTVSPNHTSALLNKDIALDTMKDYETIKQYDNTSVMETNDVYTLVERGKALYRIGSYSDAIDSFDRALIVTPNDTSILGMKRSALIMNNTSAQRDVNDLVSKGDTARIFGNYSGAIDYYDKALAIIHNDTQALRMKAFTLSDMGNYTGALHYYNKLQGMEGDERFRLSEIGDVLFGLGNYTGALSYYEKALEFSPYSEVATDGKAAVLSIFNLINETNSRQDIDIGITSNITESSKAPDLRLGSHLLKETEGYRGLEGDYKVDEKAGVSVIFGSDKLGNNIYKLQKSIPNLVRLSDSRIIVDLAFKIPVFPNSTVESIERIEGQYDLKYIDTRPDYKRFIAFSNSPLTVNNTDFSDLTIEVKMFNNDTGYLFIDGFRNN